MPSVECGFGADPTSLVRFGPTLNVFIGFDADFRPDVHAIRPELSQTNYRALVDTGATESCIDSIVAASLDLPIVDRIAVSGVHGSQEVNVHLAQVVCPDLDHLMYGRFAGVHLQAGGQAHSALLGRTFLKQFFMRYNGETGSVVISRP